MYSIEGYAIYKVKGTGIAIRNLVPNANDPRIDGEFHFYESAEKNEDGNYILQFMVRFKPENKADRNSLFAAFNALDELFEHCEDDSWYGYHTCGNYESPPKSCKSMEHCRHSWNNGVETIEHTINGEPV